MSAPDPGPDRRSVWATGQLQARAQRAERYLPETLDHPARMLPAIARRAITAYTRPGDTVLDPMCGIGTTLVEAVHLGRDGLGIELETAFATTARANLARAAAQGAPGSATVHTGDARTAAAEVAPPVGGAALLLTSPPYGSMTHGRVRSRRDGATDRKVDKWAHLYNQDRDRANLAYQRPEALLSAFAEILVQCRPLLCPGGRVVITTRPFRIKGRLVDFPSQVAEAAQDAGLVLVERCAALLCALRGEGLVGRASFFQMIETRRLRERGLPAHVIQHEDVLVLANPGGGAAVSGPVGEPTGPAGEGAP
ncbi:DNA methylase [Murinocardiopsis flavida]|uniref:Methyltransferase n=1 Tax=Murinocardiopsis flavida TaxID=645275 RepID=A0A2P8DFY9_9ACTN|nr:DNA methyltransferase [Murinocardiopsis flavida]PSK96130.1 DNA methylase [Murinocardiopsis flavida]